MRHGTAWDLAQDPVWTGESRREDGKDRSSMIKTDRGREIGRQMDYCLLRLISVIIRLHSKFAKRFYTEHIG